MSSRHRHDRISPDSPVSVRHQLLTILTEQIRKGKYQAGKRFPAERVVAAEYEISRASVREAIAQLIAQGILVRTAGRGTFVAESVPPSRLKPSSHRQIAFWISERVFHFVQAGYNQILSGVTEICRATDSSLRFCPVSDTDSLSENESLDGSIVVGGLRWDLADRLIHSGKPVILVDLLTSNHAASVVIDYSAGTRAAVDHLYELGHGRIGFIGFPNSAKYVSYWKALVDHGLAYRPEYVEFLDSSDLIPGMLAGFRAMQSLLAKSIERPTAVLVTNDNAALGAMEALGIAGLSVPHDMSVVGYDDLGLTPTPLTTVRSDLIEVGRIAARNLLNWIGTGVRPEGDATVPVELIIRSSSAAPRAAE